MAEKSQNSLWSNTIVSCPCHSGLPPPYFSSFFLYCDYHQLQSSTKNGPLHRWNYSAKPYSLEMYHLKPTAGHTLVSLIYKGQSRSSFTETQEISD